MLVIDDEPGLRQVLEITFRRQGWEVESASAAGPAIKALTERETPYPVVVTDLVMPDGSGMDVLKAARGRSDQTQVIVITAFSTVESAIEAMRQGAYDFITKPFSPAELAVVASKALEKSTIVAENKLLKAQLGTMTPQRTADLFGQDPAMRKVATLVEKAASTRTTVLITGDSGTGKEHAARILHQLSTRADGPFSVINCGALPEALMESELFGHEKGAFTGASAASPGVFRQAEGGTLLLDEVGELPLALQVKLLRVLQERKVRPVGSATEVDVDVRVLAATNRDVEKEVESGRFRKDLYYRLNVIRVELPPLRRRRGDIPDLAAHMIRRFAKEFGKERLSLSAAALRALEAYSYPGNIRELENLIERAAALAGADEIGLEDLPETVSGLTPSVPPVTAILPEQGCDLDRVLADTERRLLRLALERAHGVRKNAAELLGITFRSMRYRLAKLGMDRSQSAAEPVADEDTADDE